MAISSVWVPIFENLVPALAFALATFCHIAY